MKAEFIQSFKLPIVIGTISKEAFNSKMVEYAIQLIKYHNPQLAAFKTLAQSYMLPTTH